MTYLFKSSLYSNNFFYFNLNLSKLLNANNIKTQMLHITNNDLKGHGRSNKTFLATNIMKSQIFLRLSMIDKVTFMLWRGCVIFKISNFLILSL